MKVFSLDKREDIIECLHVLEESNLKAQAERADFEHELTLCVEIEYLSKVAINVMQNKLRLLDLVSFCNTGKYPETASDLKKTGT